MGPDTLSPEEEELYNMSDEELEAAFKEAKAAAAHEPETDDIEEEVEEIEETSEEEELEAEEEIDEDEEFEEEDSLDEEVDEDDMEQPDDEDSDEVDEDTDSEDETDEEESDESDETVEDKPAEEVIKLEDQTFKIKADGTEFEFNIEELKQLAPKAMNYTRKMQELKPWRKTISALKDNNISHDDINLMIDVLNGDKDAITSVIKRTGFDALEVDPEAEVQYAPKEYGRSEQELDIQEIEDRISKDQEYNITTHVVNNQWDDKSREAMFDNPAMIEGLHADIKSGVFDKVSPMAMKLKVLDGSRKSDIEYYMEAGAQYYHNEDANRLAAEEAAQAEEETQARLLKEREAVEQAKERKVKQKTVKKAAVKRKAAATTKKAAGTKDVMDYLDDDDEKYEEWYNKLQASM